MQPQDRLEAALHLAAGGHFIQGGQGQITNNLFDEGFVGIGFDYLHELQRWGLQLDTLCSRFVKRAVDDVRPVNQIRQRLIIKAESGARHLGNEFSAGLARRVEKLPV